MNKYELMSSAYRQHPTSQRTEIELGRIRLHRLIDEVLDQSELEQLNEINYDNARQRRRRQRRAQNSISYDPRNPLITNDDQQTSYTPVTFQVAERPESYLLRHHYDPYEAGDRVHDIRNAASARPRPRYVSDDNDLRQHYPSSSYRSRPPLFYDDLAITGGSIHPYSSRYLETGLDTMMQRHGPHARQRQHRFDNDTVYIDTIPKNRDSPRARVHDTRMQEREQNNDDNFREEYMTAKQGMINVNSLVSSAHANLQHIISQPSSDEYHA